LPWVAPLDALYDREPYRWPPGAADVTRVLADLRGPWQAEDIRPLLSSANPKVRSLAIVLLFRLERLDVLPDIARLAGDEAETFSESVMLAGGRPAQWPMEHRAVGDYAKLVIEEYMHASHELMELWRASRLPYDNPKQLVAQMTRFAERRDARFSTAGLVVAMNIATGEITPLQPQRAARVAEVLGRLQNVPEPRRFFAAVAIDFDRFHSPDYPGDYLLSEACRLPRDVRLAAVRLQSGQVDPDLEPGWANRYLLDHAVDLFRTSDADLLLQIGRQVRPQTHDAGYVVAAAQLHPADADRLLIDGLQQYNSEFEAEGRTRLATALASTGSEKGLAAALDWFFSPSPLAPLGRGREGFLHALHDRNPSRFRLIVARIIRDTRLASLGPASTFILVTSVEGYSGGQIASEDDVRLLKGCRETDRDRAGHLLEDWQRVMRQTVDEWDR
jgi:hypothetical protein